MAASKSLSTLVYNVWTSEGSDVSALASRFFDGQVDALGLLMYLSGSGHDIDEEEIEEDAMAVIEREDGDELSYESFVDKYMAPNRPVIITGLTSSWRATHEFLHSDSRSSLNVERLIKEYGECVAPVHVSNVPKGCPFGGLSRPATDEMTVTAYCDYWREKPQCSDREETETYLYLKDWKPHAISGKKSMYDCPEYFKEDWLNDLNGSYKFVYLGPAGTCTRLHADVLRSYSWSSNVTGRKRWYLIPPEYTYLLYDVFGKALAPHIHFDLESELNATMFPGLKLARKHTVIVDQLKGETIFVPSGWHHTVENLEDTFSINHNWLNGFNLEGSWKKLKEEIENERAYRKAEGSLEGVEEELKGGEGRYGDGESQIGKDLILLYEVLAFRLSGDGEIRREEMAMVAMVLQEMVEIVGGCVGEDVYGVKRMSDWRPEDFLKVVNAELGVGFIK
ncbi:hypothetical protein TrLO_g4216 [Triparma laevis f. longispina]|uniref:JmjC domain-containing protein n=1 Tax=Triparma laevis f. longispina TaxID=1714387 RepID=A0A9W7FK45_9STRA|nr:hypothetical protein TrLO_g4216 [Triparma laevis f. longispina]